VARIPLRAGCRLGFRMHLDGDTAGH
jgi:hypothetical protein